MERELIRPFGPTIAKVKMPEGLINILNTYVEKVIQNKNQSIDLDHGQKLAGNVKQEFKLEEKFIDESGWGDFLKENALDWVNSSSHVKDELKYFKIIDTWIVRQFQNEYNPLHWHSGHISGVGYLKVPKDFGETYQKNKTMNQNGKLQLVHGSKMFLSPSTYTIKPEVGDFYFFPNYLMHSVYPYVNTNEERRSISFNAYISEKVYNVYG